MKNRVPKIVRTGLLVVTLLLFATACDSADYEKAMEFYEFGQYDQAIVLFEALEDYKDSKQMIKACTYEKAKKLYDEAQYEDAITLFEQISDYQDSLTLTTEAKVLLAAIKYSNGDIVEAVNLAMEVKEHENANSLLHKIMFEEINENYNEYLNDSAQLVTDCVETMSDEIYKKLFSGQSVMLTVSSLLDRDDADVVALQALRTQMKDFYTEYRTYFSEEIISQCDEEMINADKAFTDVHDYAMRFYDPFGGSGFGQWFIATLSSSSTTYSVEGMTDIVMDLEKALNALK